MIPNGKAGYPGSGSQTQVRPFRLAGDSSKVRAQECLAFSDIWGQTTLLDFFLPRIGEKIQTTMLILFLELGEMGVPS